MKKICWISNAPAPYKVAFMKELGKKVELYCLFETNAESDREKTWYDYDSQNFTAIYLAEVNSKEVIQKMANKCDVLIDSDYTQKICMYAVKEFHKNNKIVFMHADGGLAIPRFFLIEKVVSHVMKRHDYFLSSGEETDKYYKYYGISPDKIKHYHFACMSKEEMNNNAKKIENKEEYRKECDYKEAIILFSVGQQIPRKGYDVLVKAMIDVPETVGLYIAGGNPEENVQEIIKENHLENIYFIGFKNKEELAKYYAGADIFVLPTRYDIWGLVINEAMSFGLPVISTNKCVAALEFNNHYSNAKIVNIEDSDSINKAICELAQNKEERLSLGVKSISGIQDYCFENMVNDFVDALN